MRNVFGKLAELLQFFDWFENKPCHRIEKGVYQCSNRTVIILRLLKITRSIEEYDTLELMLSFNRFLRTVQKFGCNIGIYTYMRPLDVHAVIRRVDRVLQIKIVEYDYDRTNVKLKNEIEKLKEIKRKLGQGYEPVETGALITLICHDSVEHRAIIEEVKRSLSLLGVDVDVYDINTQIIGIFLNNFCFIE